MTEERRKDYPIIATQINEITDKLNALDKMLRGANGIPGYNERIRKLEDYITRLESFYQDMRRVIIGAAGTIASAIIIAIVVYVIIPK